MLIPYRLVWYLNLELNQVKLLKDNVTTRREKECIQMLIQIDLNHLFFTWYFVIEVFFWYITTFAWWVLSTNPKHLSKSNLSLSFLSCATVTLLLSLLVCTCLDKDKGGHVAMRLDPVDEMRFRPTAFFSDQMTDTNHDQYSWPMSLSLREKSCCLLKYEPVLYYVAKAGWH